MFAFVIESMALMLAMAGFIAAAATEVNYIRNHRGFSVEKKQQTKKETALVAAE